MKASVVTAVLLTFATVTLTIFLVASFAVWLTFAAAAILALTTLLYGVRKGRFYKEELKKSRYPLMSFSLVLAPLVSSVFVFFEEFRLLNDWYKPIMLSSFTLVFFTNMLAVPLAVASRRMEEKLEKEPSYLMPVTVIIPAYNEERWIAHCIEAVLEADYPSKEIIVVDDGSTDRTFEIATKYREKGVVVLRKPNGGKASALNYGLLFASGEIIVTIDADTIINRETLKQIVKPFKDPRVVGVAGNVRVVNRVNWLTKNQALEYVTQLNIMRRATSYFGVVQVMPGPLAAFRRGTASTVGKYDKTTVTEDFDLTVKLLKTGGVIQAPSKVYAYTEAPSSLSGFYRQRLRWYRGNTQVLLRHSDALRNPRYGFLNYLIFPLLVIQQLIVPALGVVAIFAAAVIALSGGLGYVLCLYAVFSLLQSLVSLIALDLDDEDVRLVVYAPFAVIGYKHLLDIIALKSVLDVTVLRRKPRWTRAEKTGLQTLMTG
ncbi:MAG: glycosyltransferase family 2 protein [Candidatus Caldarchaeum sp.]